MDDERSSTAAAVALRNARPGAEAAHTPAMPQRTASTTRRLSMLWRLFHVAWVLLREYRAYRRFVRGAPDPGSPVRFVNTLAALGPVFVKLGQILSTRPDVLPTAYVDALARLQEHGVEVPIASVHSIVERELGKPITALFSTFDEHAVAAASLAQVHRATLLDGTSVAVKVQRPGLALAMTRDLDTLDAGLRLLARVFPGRMRRTNLAGFVAEFRRYTLQELDFAHEARVIERFRTNFRERPDVAFPRVVASHTTARVLTMGWVEGLRLHEAAATLPPEVRHALVSRLVDALLKMFVSDGLFHADLHPGNIVFHPDGTFTLLDFGMYGELTGTQRDRFILYWLAVVQRQTRRAFYHFKRQTKALPGGDEDAFFRRFAALAEKFYASPLRETSFAKVYLEMMAAGFEHGFVFPTELMLHAKALTTAEALVFALAPDARFEQLSRPFIAREYVARTASLALLKRRASQLVPELVLLGELPPPEALDEAWDWDATVQVVGEFRDRLQESVQRSLDDAGLWKTLVEPHARAVLAPTAVGGVIDAVLAESWNAYYELESTLPIAPTLGAVFTTHAAAATFALHQTLLRRGMARDESYRAIHDIIWRIYTQMAEPPLLLAAAFTRVPAKRLRLATDLFRMFPFGAPGYAWRDVPSAEGVVAFDCTRCPVAEFFAKHAASELCVKTWCRLDFPLAAKWGGRLVISGTLASGADCCDFRWHSAESA